MALRIPSLTAAFSGLKIGAQNLRPKAQIVHSTIALSTQVLTKKEPSFSPASRLASSHLTQIRHFHASQSSFAIDAGMGMPPSSNKGAKSIQEIVDHLRRTKGEKAVTNFLIQEAEEQGYVVFEGGKLIYEVLETGNGKDVKDGTNPEVVMAFAFHTPSVVTIATIETKLDVSKIPPTVRQSIVGMKEGESRLILVHAHLLPELPIKIENPEGLTLIEVSIHIVKVE